MKMLYPSRLVFALVTFGATMLGVLSVDHVDAREFRKGNRIAVPDTTTDKNPRFQSTTKPTQQIIVEPVDDEAIRIAIMQLGQDWNNGQLDKWLDPTFYDRERLLDTISQDVPRDAKLRILSVSSIRTIEQNTVPRGDNKLLRSSTVSAIIDHQIEFNDPSAGYQRLTGRSEFLFKVTAELE